MTDPVLIERRNPQACGYPWLFRPLPPGMISHQPRLPGLRLIA